MTDLQAMTEDAVRHPAHYGANRFGCETITITRLMGFEAGNAFKYICRHEDKNGVEDLRKAVVYVEWLTDTESVPVVIPGCEAEWDQVWRTHFLPYFERLPDVYRALIYIRAGACGSALHLLNRRIEELTA